MKRSAALAIVSSPDDTGADTDPVRPRTRADCKDGPRPCERFLCRQHLATDVLDNGTLTVIGGPKLSEAPTDSEIERFVDAAIARTLRFGSCALDVVDRNPDGVTLREIGEMLDVSRERIRQLERKALKPLGARIRRRLGRVLEAQTPVPALTITVQGVGR